MICVDVERNDIAHLLRRAGFGARPGEIDEALALGYDATVERLCAFAGPDAGADAVPAPTFDTAGYIAAVKSKDKAAVQAARAQANRDSTASVVWWLRRMVATDQPLRERLTWFWHGHFATSSQKVQVAELMYAQNETLRRLATGDFAHLVLAVAQDPAMLIWLDGDKSHRTKPNENFARELLELFVLGHGGHDSGDETPHHAGQATRQPYTEGDVDAAARAFTGWRLDPATCAFRNVATDHDAGVKTFLGQTGRWAGENIVEIATHHPASHRFVVSRLWSRLARPATVDEPVVWELAATYGQDRNIAGLCRRLLGHPEFRAPATRTRLLKQPVEWLAGCYRSLGLTPDDKVLYNLAGLGQTPFRPPSVGGWPANEAWLSTSAALQRLRLATQLSAVANVDELKALSTKARPEALARLLGVDAWSPTTAAALAKAAAVPREALSLALVAPEHLLA